MIKGIYNSVTIQLVLFWR